jgi:succinyl-CoA synthetase beta subunit
MKLCEHEGKQIFKQYNIDIPDGYLVEKVSEIKYTETPVLVKAQVLSGGRAKKGLIKEANNKEEIINHSTEMFNNKDLQIKHLLIENKLDIKKEYYLSIFIDREKKAPVIIVSSAGGIDIESDGKEIFKFEIDPFLGLPQFLLRNIIFKLNLKDELAKNFANIIQKLFHIYKDYHAELVEINPLILCNDNRFVAADSKIIIDDNIDYKQKNIKLFTNHNMDLSDFEVKVRQLGAVASEIKGGDIAVITSGAGLLMATIDVIENMGRKVGVGIDVAQIAFDRDTNRLKSLFNYVKDQNLKVYLISFFLQIGRCDIFAQSILESFKDFSKDKTIIIRLKGNKQERAKEILKDSGFYVTESFQEAVTMTIKNI